MGMTTASGSSQPELIIYGREGCCLCDDAEIFASRASQSYQLSLRRVDITENSPLWDIYRFRVPVVILDGEELCEGRITEQCLREALKQALEHKTTIPHR